LIDSTVAIVGEAVTTGRLVGLGISTNNVGLSVGDGVVSTTAVVSTGAVVAGRGLLVLLVGLAVSRIPCVMGDGEMGAAVTGAVVSTTIATGAGVSTATSIGLDVGTGVSTATSIGFDVGTGVSTTTSIGLDVGAIATTGTSAPPREGGTNPFAILSAHPVKKKHT